MLTFFSRVSCINVTFSSKSSEEYLSVTVSEMFNTVQEVNTFISERQLSCLSLLNKIAFPYNCMDIAPASSGTLCSRIKVYRRPDFVSLKKICLLIFYFLATTLEPLVLLHLCYADVRSG